MNHKRVLQNNFMPAETQVISQPQRFHPGWFAVLGLVLFSTLCIIGGGTAKILNLAFPAAALAVAVYLYRRFPLLYVGFTWWMFFLTPLVRRLADWKAGFTDPSPILLAPLLVAMVSFVTFYRNLPKYYRQGGLPFTLSIGSVFYSFLIALIQTSPVSAVLSFLGWISPILFGFHLFVNWRDYLSYRQSIKCNFIWGILVTGSYGLYQYIFAPEWDRLWLIETGLYTSMGSPEPLGMRVWSTMNSPLHFAAVTIAGLMLLFVNQGVLRVPASIFGYLAFMLTTVRTAWGGWFVAFIVFATSLKPRLQMRLIITIVVVALCIIPLTTVDPFSQVIQSRFLTFSNIGEDGSLNDRQALYNALFDQALNEVIGKGLGGTGPIDSGILELLLSFGWLGTIPYVSGIFILFLTLFQSREIRHDPFANCARAISFSFISMLPGSGMTSGLFGMVFWGFIGIGMAAIEYHRHQ
jgi:O-Antigen ligase